MWKLVYIFVIVLKTCSCAQFDNGYFSDRDNILDTVKFLIPTLKADNNKCREHSLFYFKELGNFKLWATEMFDATGKFPNGILYGSAYELGNFDQCLDILVPYKQEEFSGKYCMTKFTFDPSSHVTKYFKINYYDDYKKFYNTSAWEKAMAFYGDDSKASRNDVHFSFCLPSSCSFKDLQQSLNDIVRENEFEVKVKVSENNCQVMKKYHFNKPDFTFTIILVLIILIVVMCSTYDLFISIDDFSSYTVSRRFLEIIACFSFPRNLKKLATNTNNRDGLDFIAGLKVISMFLIIMGHRCMFTFGSPLVNPKFLEEMYTKVEATAILNGPIIVDTFFLISGFLASYFTLLAIEKGNIVTSIIKIYFHRLIRMLPAYAMVLAFYCTVFVNLGSGPFWQERVGIEQERCIKSWWANLLYVNNYVNIDNICMFQSWYLTCDMHYFLLVPFLAWLLKKKPGVGLAVLISIIAASMLTVFVVVYINHENGILLLYPKLLRDPVSSPTFKNIYIPTHLRATPYFVGVLTGYIKYRIRNCKNKFLPKWTSRVTWFVAVCIAMTTLYLAFIFYLPDFPKVALFSAIYGAVHHFTFSACIGYLIVAVSSGRGPWVEPILSWKPFILLGRLTYTAFLCHGAVQIYTAAIIRTPNYGGVFPTFYQTAGDIVMAFTFGFLLSMLFEAPIIGLERIIMGGGAKRQENNLENILDNNNQEKRPSEIVQIKVINEGFSGKQSFSS